jgi:excisionase family DNA binding protein
MSAEAAPSIEPAPPIQPLLSQRDVLLIFGIGERTLRRWVSQGLLRQVRVNGRLYRYHRADVEKLIDEATT